MKKLFILGLGSLSGFKLANLAKNDFKISGTYNFRNPEIKFANQHKIDVRDFSEITDIIQNESPDYIVNSIGINNVDYCEKNYEESLKINSVFLESISNFTNDLKIPLIQISTDSIFDGKKSTPYIESDIPNPINNYGKSKLRGEKAVSKFDQNLIIRVSVLYGWLPNHLVIQETSSLKQLNFGHWLILKLKSGESVKIITDEISTPILVDDLVSSILHLIKTKQQGIFHSSPPFNINRFEFSTKLAKSLGLNSDLISPTTNTELGRTVKTANNKCLNSSKLTNTGFQFLSLDESFNLLKKQINL